MTPAAASAALRERAGGEGFDLVGIARAERLDRDGEVLEAWLAGGLHASMDWMERDPAARSDPRQVLPGCRSVILLAMDYWPGKPAATHPDDRARVALYARGRDYHRVFAKRLRRLTRWIEETTGGRTRSFVDYGPVLERAWAERAGLGWIGKNANLITRDRGSWLLLGEILAETEFEVDEGPHADHCGTCTACIDACPTDAIVADGRVDANLCIAYWNIEHRGALPEQARVGLSDWIFGCDVCQDVCPWNISFSRGRADDPFERREDLQGLDPAEIVRMSEAEFRTCYSGTPLMRAKWEGMRRNAAVVLGNVGDAAALPVLEQVLADPDPTLREHVAWAIERIRDRLGSG